jgi:hypothetical protein
MILHSGNPFVAVKSTQTVTVFAPDDYRLSLLLMTLPAMSLRVLYYALANVESDGSVEIRPQVVGRMASTTGTYVSESVRTLVKYKILARRTRWKYWLSPNVARTMQIQF